MCEASDREEKMLSSLAKRENKNIYGNNEASDENANDKHT